MLRCLSNLLTEVPAEAMGQQMELRDERLVAALFIFLQFFLQKQPALLPEGLWLLNNLTGIYYSLPRSFIIIKIFIKAKGRVDLLGNKIQIERRAENKGGQVFGRQFKNYRWGPHLSLPCQ